MADCPVTKECAFYAGAVEADEGARQAARKAYCHGEYENCARYRVWEASEQAVPDDLLPGDTARADSMISQGETIRFSVDRKKGGGSQIKKQ
jgi:hypothetical protein